LSGAQHVVHAHQFNDIVPDSDPNADGEEREARMFPNGIMVMDYCPRGTLMDAMFRVGSNPELRVATPNAVLWHIFDCRMSLYSRDTHTPLVSETTRADPLLPLACLPTYTVFRMAVAIEHPVRHWSDFDEDKRDYYYEDIPILQPDGTATSSPPAKPPASGPPQPPKSKASRARTRVRPKAPNKQAGASRRGGRRGRKLKTVIDSDNEVRGADVEDNSDPEGGGGSSGPAVVPRTYNIDESKKQTLIHFDIDPTNRKLPLSISLLLVCRGG